MFVEAIGFMQENYPENVRPSRPQKYFLWDGARLPAPCTNSTTTLKKTSPICVSEWSKVVIYVSKWTMVVLKDYTLHPSPYTLHPTPHTPHPHPAEGRKVLALPELV